MEFKISEMAQMHGITRQTLIYYDRIGLFKPARKDENGNRYYTAEQMPMLREICLLKQLDIPLKEIQETIGNYEPESAMRLLEKQISAIHHKQENLDMIERILQVRLDVYHMAEKADVKESGIFVTELPERSAWFVPWPDEEMTQEKLHLCYARAMAELEPMGIIPGFGFGACIRENNMWGESPLKDAGSVFFLPEGFNGKENVMTLPAGIYLCRYVLDMPYRVAPIEDFLNEIREKEIPVEGDLISFCVLDSNFHSNTRKEDYCQLQIKISDPEEFEQAWPEFKE